MVNKVGIEKVTTEYTEDTEGTENHAKTVLRFMAAMGVPPARPYDDS